MVTMQEALHIRITKLCKKNNISLNKLAALSDVNQSTLNEFMQGRTKYPGIATIKKISNGLDMTLSEFFDDEIFNQISFTNKEKND